MRIVTGLLAFACLPAVVACQLEPEPDDRNEQVYYRVGTADDGYLSNGERGNFIITEIHWAGSVEQTLDGFVHHPDDVFIELQNRHNRPMYLTGWLLTVQTGVAMDTVYVERDDRQEARWTYVFPAREGNRPVEPNEFIVVAARRDGAFREADFYIEDLRLPAAPFSIVLQDLDERLLDAVGDHRKPVFAGSWDLVTARSMERTQLLFNNRGDRDLAWHSYGLNDFDEGDNGLLHADLRSDIHETFLARTLATPGRPNSPDYSGNVSSGSFE
jgi:hypothetical protein